MLVTGNGISHQRFGQIPKPGVDFFLPWVFVDVEQAGQDTDDVTIELLKWIRTISAKAMLAMAPAV